MFLNLFRAAESGSARMDPRWFSMWLSQNKIQDICVYVRFGSCRVRSEFWQMQIRPRPQPQRSLLERRCLDAAAAAATEAAAAAAAAAAAEPPGEEVFGCADKSYLMFCLLAFRMSVIRSLMRNPVNTLTDIDLKVFLPPLLLPSRATVPPNASSR